LTLHPTLGFVVLSLKNMTFKLSIIIPGRMEKARVFEPTRKGVYKSQHEEKWDHKTGHFQ